MKQQQPERRGADSGQHDWDTLRDAEYLAIARLQADALVTVDPSLAAKAEDVVPIAPVQALLAGA